MTQMLASLQSRINETRNNTFTSKLNLIKFEM